METTARFVWEAANGWVTLLSGQRYSACLALPARLPCANSLCKLLRQDPFLCVLFPPTPYWQVLYAQEVILLLLLSLPPWHQNAIAKRQWCSVAAPWQATSQSAKAITCFGAECIRSRAKHLDQKKKKKKQPVCAVVLRQMIILGV